MTVAFLLALLLSSGPALATRSFHRVKLITISGCVKQGVEGGCRVIESFDGKRHYVLVGDSLMVGAAYRVVGRPRSGMSVCMQGPLLEPRKAILLKKRCPPS